MATCSAEEGCDGVVHCRGLCKKHHTRLLRNGTTTLIVISPQERFWSHVDRSGDCWLWTGTVVGRGGYGQCWDSARKKMVPAHRYSYEQEVGAIPEGLQVDHRPTCVRRCVRPEHLRLATNKQNCENRSGVSGVSGIRGVYPNGRNWMAYVGHHGQRLYLGTFPTPGEAEAVVVAKRNELFTHNDLDRMVG